MRNPGGYAIWTGEGGSVEMDTFTCCHCNAVVFVRPPNSSQDPLGVAPDPGGFCRMCMKPTCRECADKGICAPFERRLEQQERADRLRQAVSSGVRW